MALLSVARLGLCLDRLRELPPGAVFLTGLRFDAVLIAGLSTPLILAGWLLPQRLDASRARWTPRFVAAALFLVLYLSAVDWVHFRFYDSRLNYLFLDHAFDPAVLGSVFKNDPWFSSLLAALALAGCGAWASGRLARALARRAPQGKLARLAARWVAPLLCAALAGLALRGSVGHRAINPSAASLGSDRVLNELAGSGIYRVVYELAQRSRRKYTTLDQVLEVPGAEPALKTTRAWLQAEGGEFVSGAENPLLREISSGRPARRWNVVVIVMESLTGRLVGALGGKPALSPHLDAIARESWLWRRCYATGERTIQGLEAVLASFPPMPGVGVIRRPQAQGGFATLAAVLKARGYENHFYFGGEGSFDQMRGFFLNNGYDRFVEERDFPAASVTFRGKWGVCDEDVFRRLHEDLEARTPAQEPCFATLLTASLHSPWEYPPGKIQRLPSDTEVPPGFSLNELNTFLYADYALGRFWQAARASSYFDRTLFVFVGDHGVHLRGRGRIPAQEYLVPALIHAPGLKAKALDSPSSQLDLAPTVLGLLGGTYRTPFFGRDLSRVPRDEPGLGLLVYHKRTYGVMRGLQFTILPSRGAQAEGYLVSGSELLPAPLSAEHAALGLGILRTAEDLLESRRYVFR